MPAVIVQFVQGLLDEESAAVLAEAVATEATWIFDDPKSRLLSSDFDFTFAERGVLDRPTKKLIIRIQINDFAGPRSDGGDAKATQISQAAASALAGTSAAGSIDMNDIGTSIVFARIAWGVSGLADM